MAEKGIQVRKGAMLFWRLGPLKFQDQKNFRRRNVPTSRGMWVFPWPYYDSFFTYHQYSYLLPKRLQSAPRSHWPLTKDWYEVGEYNNVERQLLPNEKLIWPEPDEDGRLGMPTSMDKDGNILELTTKEGFYEAQTEWINTVGTKVLPLRKFWYEGEVYSHIRKNGEIGNAGTFMGDTEWFKMHTTDLARVIVKNRGDEAIERPKEKGQGLSRHKYSKDHLEIFIPAGEGKIISPRSL